MVFIKCEEPAWIRESPRFSRDKHELSILVEGLFQQRCYGVVATDFSHSVSTSLLQSCQKSLIQPCRRQLLRICYNKLVTSLQTSCDKPVTTSDNNVCVDFWLASDSNKLVTSLQQNCYNWCVFGRVPIIMDLAWSSMLNSESWKVFYTDKRHQAAQIRPWFEVAKISGNRLRKVKNTFTIVFIYEKITLIGLLQR